MYKFRPVLYVTSTLGIRVANKTIFYYILFPKLFYSFEKTLWMDFMRMYSNWKNKKKNRADIRSM